MGWWSTKSGNKVPEHIQLLKTLSTYIGDQIAELEGLKVAGELTQQVIGHRHRMISQHLRTVSKRLVIDNSIDFRPTDAKVLTLNFIDGDLKSLGILQENLNTLIEEKLKLEYANLRINSANDNPKINKKSA